MVPDLIDKITSRQNETDPISVGNLASKRDYTDVRDVANAYMLLATHSEQPKQLIYNICSGVSLSGEEILTTIANAMGIQTPATKVDKSLIRPNEVMNIRGDNSAITNEFGWKPTIAIDTTVKDIIAAA